MLKSLLGAHTQTRNASDVEDIRQISLGNNNHNVFGNVCRQIIETFFSFQSISILVIRCNRR